MTFRSREEISRRWYAGFGRWAPLRPAIRPIGYPPLLLSKIAQFADRVTDTIANGTLLKRMISLSNLAQHPPSRGSTLKNGSGTATSAIPSVRTQK
jgi:hypothetical protein